MSKNYKNLNFNKKEDYLYALNMLIVMMYKAMKRYRTYNDKLTKYLSELDDKTDYIDNSIYEEWSDLLHNVSCELIKCLVDETSTGFSYVMFRKFIKKSQYNLEEWDEETKKKLNELRDIRNWSFHLAQSDFVAAKEVFKKSIPSEMIEHIQYNFHPIIVGISDKAHILLLYSLSAHTENRLQWFNELFQLMKDDYEKLLGNSTYIKEFTEGPLELLDANTAAIQLSMAMQRRKYDGSSETFEKITFSKANNNMDFEL